MGGLRQLGALGDREGVVPGVDPLDSPQPRPLHEFPLDNLERYSCDGGREEPQMLPNLSSPSTFTESTLGLTPSLSDPLQPADALLLDRGPPEFPQMWARRYESGFWRPQSRFNRWEPKKYHILCRI